MGLPAAVRMEVELEGDAVKQGVRRKDGGVGEEA